MVAAYAILHRHATVTAYPETIRSLAEATIASWRRAATEAGGAHAFRGALLELKARLIQAMHHAQDDGALFEGLALKEALSVLDEFLFEPMLR